MYENDVRLLATVIRHMLIHAPDDQSEIAALNKGSVQLVTSPGGVCRLRVGTRAERRAGRLVDALAMPRSRLRAIMFFGEPLGAVGAAVAMRQARALRLAVPRADTAAQHRRVLKLVLREDVLRNALAMSPSLAQLVMAGFI